MGRAGTGERRECAFCGYWLEPLDDSCRRCGKAPTKHGRVGSLADRESTRPGAPQRQPTGPAEPPAGPGRPDNPLVHAEYSAGSRVPRTSFVDWVAQRLREGDVGACQGLIWGLVGGGPGLGVGRDDWDEIVAYCGTFEVERSVSGLPPGGADWLRACLVMVSVSEMLMYGYAVATEAPRLLARAAVHLTLTFPDLADYVQAMNRFIRKMRRQDGRYGYWSGVDYYRLDDLVRPAPESSNQQEVDTALGHVSTGARLFFFDLLSRTGRSRHAVCTADAPYYATKCFGVDPEQSVREFASVGLVRPGPDSDAAWTFTGRELVEGIRRLGGRPRRPPPKLAWSPSYGERRLST